jgi:hypothetical protein
MDIVLSGLRYDICMCYLDDVIVFSSTIEEHIDNLKQVFLRMRKENLLLKPTKCHFLFQEIKILGFIVNSEGIHMDPMQVKEVQDLPDPKTKKDVQKKLGLFSYFRKFIRDYSKIG